MSGKTSDKGPLDQRMTVQEDGRISHLSMQWFYDPTKKPDEDMDNFYTVRTSHVQPLICGADSMAHVLHVLQGARHSIDIGVWCFDPSLCLNGYNPGLKENFALLGSLVPPYDASPRIGDLLLAAALRGVKVRLLVWTGGDLMFNPTHWNFLYSDVCKLSYHVLFEVKYDNLNVIEKYYGISKVYIVKMAKIILFGAPTAILSALPITFLRELFIFFIEIGISCVIANIISGGRLLDKIIRYVNNSVEFASGLPYRIAWYEVLEHVSNIEIRTPGTPLTSENIIWLINTLIRDKKSLASYEDYILYGNYGYMPKDSVKDEALKINTHHQKCVIVDYGTPHAAGLVMGNNLSMTDFDSLAHPFESGVRGGRFPGKGPRQDISSFVRGSVLEDMRHNFNCIWNGEGAPRSPASATGEARGEPTWIQAVMERYRETFNSQSGLEQLEAAKKKDIIKHPAVLGARKYSQEWLAGQRYPEGNCQLSTTRIHFKGKENSIAKAHWRAIDCCTSFVYFENQYFRYEKMAIALKARVYNRRKANDKKGNEPLYFFVAINDAEPFAFSTTYGMLKNLGHEGQMPAEAHKQYERLLKDEERMRASIKRREQGSTDKKDVIAGDETFLILIEAEKKKLEENYPQIRESQAKPQEAKAPQGKEEQTLTPREAKDIETAQEAFSLREDPLLKGHIAVLMVCKPPANGGETGYSYKSVYIHTKVTIVDDVYIIIGSANMHERGMEYDNEIDISTTRPGVARDTRRTLFATYTENDKDIMNEQAGWAKVYKGWKKLLDENWERHYETRRLKGMLFYFYTPTVSSKVVTLD